MEGNVTVFINESSAVYVERCEVITLLRMEEYGIEVILGDLFRQLGIACFKLIPGVILIEVDVSYPKLTRIGKLSEALNECLVFPVVLRNEAGVTVKAEIVLLNDVLSDLSKVSVCVDRNTVMLTVVNGGICYIIVCVGEINIGACLCYKLVNGIEISFKGVLNIFLVMHKADIGEILIVVCISRVKGVVVIVVTYGGYLDLNNARVLLVKLLNKVEEDLLVGLTDNAPHIELNVLEIINDELAVLVSGKVIGDILYVGTADCVIGIIFLPPTSDESDYH